MNRKTFLTGALTAILAFVSTDKSVGGVPRKKTANLKEPMPPCFYPKMAVIEPEPETNVLCNRWDMGLEPFSGVFGQRGHFTVWNRVLTDEECRQLDDIFTEDDKDKIAEMIKETNEDGTSLFG